MQPNEDVITPEYVVHSVDEHAGKPCVLIFSEGFFYLLTNIDVLDESIGYDFAVGRPLPEGKVDWLDDGAIENIEDHGAKVDVIISDVLNPNPA